MLYFQSSNQFNILKMTTRTKIEYVAPDGSVFNTAVECVGYENNINEFIDEAGELFDALYTQMVIPGPKGLKYTTGILLTYHANEREKFEKLLKCMRFYDIRYDKDGANKLSHPCVNPGFVRDCTDDTLHQVTFKTDDFNDGDRYFFTVTEVRKNSISDSRISILYQEVWRYTDIMNQFNEYIKSVDRKFRVK